MERGFDIAHVQKYREELNKTAKHNILFRNQEKLGVAQNVSSKFEIDNLLQSTIYMIPNTNKLYIDYSIFKLYANPSNYDSILHYFMTFFKDLGSEDVGASSPTQFEFHINMQSLTASACERYKEIIIRFFQSPEKDECLRKISMVVVYNTPSVIDILSNFVLKMMKNDEIIPSVFYNKKESGALLGDLFGNSSSVEHKI